MAASTSVLAQRYTTFGPTGAATIGDRVWNDSNANGIQDAGESGIAGAALELFAAGGASVGGDDDQRRRAVQLPRPRGRGRISTDHHPGRLCHDPREPRRER